MKVGLVIMLAENAHLGRAPTYGEIRTLAVEAEHAGFDTIWLYDHLIYRPENAPQRGIWECWTMLSALAEATKRVEIGTVVLCTAFRNPAVLAKMAATLDEVSNGRFILGIGAGWNQPEFDAFGLPFDHKADRFEEALKIIVPLVREGKVDFAGKYYQARSCEISPRGPTPTGPPIMIGAFGPRMLRLTAQYADIWNTAYFTEPETFAKPRADLEAACAAVGRDPATLEQTVVVSVAYPDLAPAPTFLSEYLTDPPEALAATLKGYEALGVGQVMIHSTPNNLAALERLSAVLDLYHGT